MFFSEKTLDDLMRKVMSGLLDRRTSIVTSRGNIGAEINGVLLELKNPLARISRTETRGKLFSALGELFWYLSQSNQSEFIENYVPGYAKDKEPDNTIYGAYGPRLFSKNGSINQVDNVIKALKEKPNSRRAVIQIFDAQDIHGERKIEIPCTCSLQFLIREQKLQLMTSMRSNDACLGMPHDFFTFTMLQEIVARSLGVGLGSYFHFVGNLHLYEEHIEKVESFISEGWQSTKIMMEKMPEGDPWQSIEMALKVEQVIRSGGDFDVEMAPLTPYWKDILRLLQIYFCIRAEPKKNERAQEIRQKMHSKVFDIFIDSKIGN